MFVKNPATWIKQRYMREFSKHWQCLEIFQETDGTLNK